jgi:multidrug efflux pump subunit AcrA (membrane-fusion protein)
MFPISLDAYPNKRYKGYVAKIVPTADRAKATVLVKVGFNSYDERVLPEMSAKVLFLSEKDLSDIDSQELLLVIPQSAITAQNGKNIVYRVNNEVAYETEVTLGQKIGSHIEIIHGLNIGDRVIRNLNGRISDGMNVKVK